MFIGTFVFENPSDTRIGAHYTNSAYSLTNYMYIDVELVKKYGYHPSLIFVGVKKPDFEYEHYPVYVNRYENNIKRLSLLKNNKLVCFATGITKEGEKLYFALDAFFAAGFFSVFFTEAVFLAAGFLMILPSLSTTAVLAGRYSST